MRKVLLVCIAIATICASCQQDEKVAKPRPKQYPKIDWPADGMVAQEPGYCDFSIEIPEYAILIKKEKAKPTDLRDDCWFDIRMDHFNATVHCSYYPIDQINSYQKLVEDAYTMASKHNVRANYRDEIAIQTAQGSTGLIFKIDGPVATPYQFFLSDQKEHFLRGSLYFDQKVEVDSMAAIITLIEADLDQVIGSVRWKE